MSPYSCRRKCRNYPGCVISVSRWRVWWLGRNSTCNRDQEAEMHLWLTKSKVFWRRWRWGGVGVWWELSSSFPSRCFLEALSCSIITFKHVSFLLPQNLWKPDELHMQWVLFGDTREGDEVRSKVKTVRKKGCEVLSRTWMLWDLYAPNRPRELGPFHLVLLWWTKPCSSGVARK